MRHSVRSHRFRLPVPGDQETMATRAVKREDGVLKLVYLGWFVELYWEPITAREVMKKNPKHSVTPPDFWKYPWIVIEPDSVLKPGRVFYIIPNDVIHDLIKAYRLQNQLSSMKDLSQYLGKPPLAKSGSKMTPNYTNPGRVHRNQLPVDTRAKVTAMEQSAHRRVKQQSPSMSGGEMNLEKQTSHRHLAQKSGSRSRAKMTNAGQDHDQFLKEQHPFWLEEILKHETNDQSFKLLPKVSRAWVEAWLDVTTKQQYYRLQEFEGDSGFKVRPLNTSEYAYDDGDCSEIPTKEDRAEFDCGSQIHLGKPYLRTQSDNGRKSYGEVHIMKSCLRTQSDNGRKSNGNRVTFVLPCKGAVREEVRS